MSRKKYAGEDVIRKKITALFSYRKLTDLMAQSGLDKNKTFVQQLYDLQYSIYLLDAYLESQWDLANEERSVCWKRIETAVSGLHFSPRERKELLKEIRVYEKIELDCRHDRWPTRQPFKTFYTIKSCDVRLIRHILYDAHPALDDLYHEKTWVYYDRITEIHDDIADLHEDLHTFNGNRFLISILRKGQDKTLKQYDLYLRKAGEKAKAYFKPRIKRGENHQLYQWTREQADETLALLHDTITNLDHNTLRTSLMLEKMK